MTAVAYTDTSGPVIARLRTAIASAMSETAAALEGEAKKQAQALIYSTPESPSYRRTGNLINSITHASDATTATATAAAEYAIPVHEGTRYVSPRPFMANALRVEGAADRVAERLRRALR